jgi:hypothetical protein
MFRSIPFYVKLYKNKIEIVRLDDRNALTREASDNFSNERLIVADFSKFEHFLRSTLKELLPKTFLLQPTLKLLFHVMEDLEGELSTVEKRVLLDSGEHAGGKIVRVYQGKHELSVGQALEELNKKNK